MTQTVDKATVKAALGFTRSAATTLAKGPAATGFVVAKRGVKELRARRAARRAVAPRPVRATAARGRSTPVVLAAVLIGGAAVVALARSRRREVPPVADAPPSLNSPAYGAPTL